MISAGIFLWWLAGFVILAWDNECNWKKVDGCEDYFFGTLLNITTAVFGPLVLVLCYAMHNEKRFSNISIPGNPFRRAK